MEIRPRRQTGGELLLKSYQTKSVLAMIAMLSDGDMRRLPTVVRNQALVLKGFAGDEVVANFEQEKQRLLGTKTKVVDNTLPGWELDGAGISKKKKRSKGRFLTKEEGDKQQNRKDIKT
jgi:U3 small nucleolar RNA-associated protein 14